MAQKTILVTGGNKGIGREVCKQLKAAGERVILTARKVPEGEAAAKDIGVEFRRLDVADHDSFMQFAEEIGSHYGKIDALINNAGVLLGRGDANLLDSTRESVEDSIRTNSLGPLYLTSALRPLLKQSSQVVMVSSGAGEFCSGINFSMSSYSLSKTMLNVITRHLANAMKADGVFVNAVCPGWVRTDMGGSNAPAGVEEGAETIVWLAQGNVSESGNFYRNKRQIQW